MKAWVILTLSGLREVVKRHASPLQRRKLKGMP